MRVAFDNREVLFTGPREVARALDDRTAYRVQGFQFSPAWRARRWDGKEHLVLKRKDHYRIPVGLLGDLLTVAAAQEVDPVLDDRRRDPELGTVETRWNPDFVLRDYQIEAVEAVVRDRGPLTGKGLIRIPTRGGKTVVMAGIVDRLKCRTLVLVQSQLLMDQTVALFERALGIKVGRVGAGMWDPGPVTVASCQTLTRNPNETSELLGAFDAVFFDEVHHLQGKVWRSLLEAIDAFYKVGFSATIFLSKKKEAPKGTIWVRAATGPILSSREPSDLIRAGFLIQPWVELVKVGGEPVAATDWASIYQLGVVEHAERNRLIVEATLRHHRAGLQVLVVVERIDHTAHLAGRLEDAGLRVAAITGETPASERRRVIKAYTARHLDAIVGTVFGEGVDLPAIEAVVNAEGGKSEIAAMQRFRCLTPADGKDTAILTDFLDLHNKMLAKHSLERMQIYRGHEMFRLRVPQ